MANNRMYLRCKHCGESILIAKRTQSPWYIFYDNLDGRLDEFFEKHGFCDNPIARNANEFFPPFEQVESSEGEYEICYEFSQGSIQDNFN